MMKFSEFHGSCYKLCFSVEETVEETQRLIPLSNVSLPFCSGKDTLLLQGRVILCGLKETET